MPYEEGMRRALLLALLFPLAAQAAEPIHARYAIYAGGLNVAVLHADFLVGPSAYEIRLANRTAGIVSMVVTANIVSAAAGRFDKGTAVPERFTSAGRMRGEPRKTELDYVHGVPQVRTLVPPLAEEGREPVPPGDQAGTVDTLSAMAQLVHSVNETGRCDGHVTAFDGRRLLSITSRTGGTQDLPQTSLTSFAGPTLRCDLVSQQLGGFKHDADETRLRRPQTGNAWFGRLSQGGPLVLVRATFPTTFFGSATLYLQPGGE